MKEEFLFKLEGKEWGTLQDDAFNKVNQKAKIDGFRPGKAPRDVYEKKYGKQDIFYEAADIAIKKEYDRLLNDKKLLPIIEPKIDLISLDENKIEVKFVFVTDPKVTLGEYTNLNVKMEKAKVTKEEIKERIDALLNDYAELIEKEDAVVDGDIAVIDFAGYNNGVAFEGGTAENYSLTIGSHSFIPGFEEAIIGMKKGDKKDIPLTFPEDYMSEDLKGKDVIFKVKVNEVKTRVIPELNKDFYEDLGMEGVNDKESLEKQIKEELEHHKEHELHHKYEEDCLDKASSNMKVELVQELIDDEAEHLHKEFMQKMQMQGVSEEMYYEYTKSKKEDLIKQMLPEAEKRLKYRYLLKEVIKTEKIKVTDKEVKSRVKEMADMYKVSEETILKEVSLDNVKFDLMYQKALDIVTKNEK